MSLKHERMEASGEVWQHEASMEAVARHKGDTPRTDAELKGWVDTIVMQSRLIPAEDFANMRDLARDLERELAAANKRADEAERDARVLREQNADLADFIKRQFLQLEDLKAQLAAANKRADEASMEAVARHGDSGKTWQQVIDNAKFSEIIAAGLTEARNHTCFKETTPYAMIMVCRKMLDVATVFLRKEPVDSNKLAAVARHKGDTPRTDVLDVELHSNGWQMAYETMRWNARKLERELAATNKRADEARAVAIEDVCSLQRSHDRENWNSLEDEQKSIRALAKLLPGNVVVPAEPTDKMLEAAWRILSSPQGEAVKLIYKAMLAARPK